MPFMFKLSRRLARIRRGALLLSTAASAACEKPGANVSGPAQPGTQVAKVVVSPDNVSLLPSQSKQFTAFGRTEAGDSVTVSVSWSGAGGAISLSGVYSAGATPGAYQVVATQTGGSLTGSATVRVSAVPVTAVAVSPSSATVQTGGTVQFAAATTDSVGAVLSGRPVTWASSNPAVAVVSASGLVGGVAAGTATITATSEGKRGMATVTVTTLPPPPPPPPAPVASVTLSPASAGVTVGQAVQLTATLRDTSGNVLMGRTVAWATSAGGVATVSASGLVTGVGAGTAMITATSEATTGAAQVTVAAAATQPGAVSDLAVAGTTSSAATLAFTEVDDGTGQPAKYEVRWTPGTTLSWGSAANVANGSCATPIAGTTIGAKRTCTVLGLAAGTAYAFELVAYRGTLGQGPTFGGLSNVVTTTTAASSAPVAVVTVNPATASVGVGQPVQFTATLRDAAGNGLSGRMVSWSSGAVAVATVSGTGLVTGVTAGTVMITATSEGVSGTAALSVTALPPSGTIDTLYRDDFESGSLNWDDSAGGATHLVVADASFAYSGSHYLKILYPVGVNGGGSLSKFLLPGYTKAYLRYRMRIPGNFVGGTKLIMFRGSDPANVWASFGVAGSCPNGTNWFLANVVARDQTTLPLRFYSYYPGMHTEPDGTTCWGRYGDSYDPGGASANPASYFSPLDVTRDVWHTVEFEVQLNDPGQANGVQRFWLDGVLRGEWRNFVFRTTSTLRITAFTLESSMNETQGGSPQNEEMYVDDILVTTSRPTP